MAEVALTKNEFKALSSEARVNILKMLNERNFTLSELSTKMSMAPPTVKQHASILSDCGMIELKDEGRKWKYYSLTKKGKEIVSSKEKQTNFLIILGSSAVVLIGIALLFSNFLMTQQNALDAGSELGDGALPMMQASETTGLKTAQGRCVPTFEVQEITAPNAGISASQHYASECTTQTTKEGCEAVDVYSEAETAFGKADGNPDCEWQANFSEK